LHIALSLAAIREYGRVLKADANAMPLIDRLGRDAVSVLNLLQRNPYGYAMSSISAARRTA
jgi:hypothetical protein